MFLCLLQAKPRRPQLNYISWEKINREKRWNIKKEGLPCVAAKLDCQSYLNDNAISNINSMKKSWYMANYRISNSAICTAQ